MLGIVQERFLRLSTLSLIRPLTPMEQKEVEESRKYLLRVQWELDKLNTLAAMAYEMQDYAWLHDICSRIDKLEGRC